jgi:hypothetical protein
VAELEKLASLLAAYRLASASEEELQSAVLEVLAPGREVVREYDLGKAGRIDFFLPVSGVGIECKVDGGRYDLVRQLQRYCKSPEISGILVVTTRGSHADLPAIDKPVLAHLALWGAL